MANIENFRTALHGFNRSDVVQFIQSQTMEHEKALRVLREENSRLQDALVSARMELEECNEEKEALLAEMEALKTELEALKAAPPAPAPLPVAAPMVAPVAEAPVSALDEPIQPVAAVAAVAPSDFNEMELAAYRRAEMTERMARERANASADRMKSIFSQADEKLTLTAQDFSTLMDAFRSDFEQMEQLLATAQSIVNESSDGLKAASEVADDI